MNQVIRNPGQLGSLIQADRLKKGLTQKALAELTGIGQKTISHIENGQDGTKLETIFTLLAALELELNLASRSKSAKRDISEIF